MNVSRYLQETYSFEAWVLMKNIFKNRFDCLMGLWKSFHMILVWLLYNKNWPSYSNPSEEKRECSREAKIRSTRPTWTTRMRQLHYSCSGCSYSYQTYSTWAVNINYQINAKKWFCVFRIEAPSFILCNTSLSHPPSAATCNRRYLKQSTSSNGSPFGFTCIGVKPNGETKVWFHLHFHTLNTW